MSARFVLGLDGGGSKTAACCLDEGGKLLSEAVFGPLNINSGDRGAVTQSLADACRHARELEARGFICAGLVIAAAGVSNPESRDFIQQALNAQGFSAPFELAGDQEAALRGAVGPMGAVLVAGTGSICFGRNAADQSRRAGGWGYLLDDEGGGYALGRDVLRAALRADDGRGERTVLNGLLKTERGLANERDIIRFAYDPVAGKKNIAGLAPLLNMALEQGDPAADGIIKNAARELLLLAGAVLRPLRLEKEELALMGGVLENLPALRAAVEAGLNREFPGLQVIAPRHSAAYGAAQLALERYLI